jgi:hypothetical protein
MIVYECVYNVLYEQLQSPLCVHTTSVLLLYRTIPSSTGMEKEKTQCSERFALYRYKSCSLSTRCINYLSIYFYIVYTTMSTGSADLANIVAIFFASTLPSHYHYMYKILTTPTSDRFLVLKNLVVVVL